MGSPFDGWRDVAMTSRQSSAAAATAASTAADSPMPSRRSAGWHPTTTTRSTEPPRRASVASTSSGLMVWASTAAPLAAGPAGHRLRLDDRQRAGLLAHGDGVDEHQGVVALEELVGQVDAADPEVLDPDALGELPGPRAGAPHPLRTRRRTGTRCRCPPPGSVPSPALLVGRDRLHFFGVEVQVATLPHQFARRGVVVERHGQVDPAVDVVEHPGHRGGQPVEEHVLRVGAGRGVEPDGGPRRELDAVDPHRVAPRVDRGVGRRVPPFRLDGPHLPVQPAERLG